MRITLALMTLAGAGGCARWQKPMLEAVEQLRIATDAATKVTMLACRPVVEICKLQRATIQPPPGPEWRCRALEDCHTLQTHAAKVVQALQLAVAAAAQIPR